MEKREKGMTKNKESILNDLVKKMKDLSMECARKIEYMKEHKFEMECEAYKYKLEAFERCWVEVACAVDKINDLEEENCCKNETSTPRWKRMENGIAGNSDHDIFWYVPPRATTSRQAASVVLTTILNLKNWRSCQE